MKRQIFRFFCFVLAAVLVFSLCSCSSKEKHNNPYSIATEILEHCSDDIEMIALTSKQTSTYFGIDIKYLSDFSVYVSSKDDRYDTVAVFSYNNKEARTAIADAVAGHVKNSETTAMAVNDTEFKKIQNRILMETKDKLIFVISDNSSEIEKMLKKMGAKKF